ncbi:calcium-dependent protein kinase [Datura stramonium]|uniref:Calcium-dependent protein kinase n=1 Tax=Datura stramonium TaxID=4076 RepID=A0ABS8T2Z7_DATST|nr:calcium-dependent protein kinase [Datura stramonium]
MDVGDVDKDGFFGLREFITKNGYIEIEEVEEALDDEIETNSEEVINAIMQDVDTDKVRRTDRDSDEFSTMMKAEQIGGRRQDIIHERLDIIVSV